MSMDWTKGSAFFLVTALAMGLGGCSDSDGSTGGGYYGGGGSNSGGGSSGGGAGGSSTTGGGAGTTGGGTVTGDCASMATANLAQCDLCKLQNCCQQVKDCEALDSCVGCFTGTGNCDAHSPTFEALVACEQGPCYSPCHQPSTGGGGTIDCTTRSCSDGCPDVPCANSANACAQCGRCQCS